MRERMNAGRSGLGSDEHCKTCSENPLTAPVNSTVIASASVLPVGSDFLFFWSRFMEM